jgi:hypothetical protein
MAFACECVRPVRESRDLKSGRSLRASEFESTLWYTPHPLSQRDLVLIRRIDELHLEWRYYGSRKLAAQLRREGHDVGRLHVTTLMRRMSIEALYRRPRTRSQYRPPYLSYGRWYGFVPQEKRPWLHLVIWSTLLIKARAVIANFALRKRARRGRGIGAGTDVG